MVAHSASSANQDLTWPALTGKRAMRGSDGIGRHVACWIAEQLGYVVVSMVPIAKAEGRKVPYETWGDAKPGREAGIASEYRSPFEIMRAKHFRIKCGVGILAGKSGLVCIDIDDEDSWEEFVGMQELPRTLEFGTHKGRHIVFRDETGISFKTQGSQLAPGVDVRGRGGLFVVYDPGQPERHPTDLTEPAELPGWLRAAIPLAGSRGHRKGSKGNPPPKVDINDILRGIPPGQHHDRLNAVALALVNRGVNVGDQEWYDIATGILARSREGTDSKGNQRTPFSDTEIMDCLHTAQAKRRDELAARKADPAARYRGAEIVQFAADVPDVEVEWIWERYIPRCVLTQVDGEKTVGKTTSYADIVARATTGRAMPGEEEAICDPLNVFIFTEELPTINKKKLRAAGADLSRVAYPHPEFRDAIARMLEEKNGGITGAVEEAEEEDFDYLLPTGVDLILEMIRSAQAELVIWDPISNYFDTRKADVNSDASVRRALEPLVQGLESMNAAGMMFRHMNKDRHASARHRGSGTTAFQNVGRVHLVMGRLPADYTEDGEYGLSMVANNYTVAVKGTLTFDVVDSDVKLDNRGNMIGKIVWHGIDEDMDAETLVRGSGHESSNGSGKPGPTPHVTMAIKRILIEMGKERSVWDASEGMARVMEGMKELGFDEPNHKMVHKARNESMITSKSRPGAVGLNDWHWPAQPAPRARA